MDHATVCNDCGSGLVAADALGTEETLRAVADLHARAHQEALTNPEPAPQSARRLDIATGVALVGLCLALTGVSYLMAWSEGGGTYFTMGGPLAYGIFRLIRGLSSPKAS